MFTTLALTADHWHDGGPPDFWPIFPLFWLIVIVAAVVFFVRARRNSGVHAGEARLAERFAAGEIDEAEYHTRRDVLRKR